MKELKWKVIQEVIVAKARSTGNHDEETDAAADRVLQHFAEAMLSDKALDAATNAAYVIVPATERTVVVGQVQVNVTEMIHAALKAIGATED